MDAEVMLSSNKEWRTLAKTMNDKKAACTSRLAIRVFEIDWRLRERRKALAWIDNGVLRSCTLAAIAVEWT